ncbi:MAG TPA: hypothetical protein VNI54_11620 [Thermoanaerobaculia bacterium]|nr:hypothetical protein [Thermoanaerobaculia bacterium]
MQLDSEIVDRLRNAVYWTPNVTIAGLVEGCIRETVDRMESERGATFPERTESLRVGRPKK